MPQAIPQRIITITINGNDNDAQVLYTYQSPVTGQSYVNSPNCDMEVNRAIYSLFVLDYATTLNGWAIKQTSPYQGSAVLSQVPGAFNLSLLTFNPYTTEHLYRFYIHYRNSITGAEIARDPQEGNLQPPH